MNASNRLRMNTALSSDDVIALGHVTGIVSQLAILDTYWTISALELSVKPHKGKTDELRKIVDQLEAILVASQADFARLGDIFAANADHIRQGYSVVVSGNARGVRQPPKEKLNAFVALVDTFGGDMAEAAIAASRRLAGTDRIENERRMLNAEFSKLAAGDPSGGDLSDEQWMDVHMVAMGAAVVLGAEAGLVVEAAAALWELIFG